uniref:Cytochrome P450 76M5 n=1 Tax=Elaeis guineensis var. tenera TaxID=51953 RepID=A0A6I9QY70_ELAGV|nr:cytochrome P450 76M5 [Elaeis guineensis]
MDLPLSLLWISLTLALLYFLATAAKKNSSTVRLPPGPAGLPILGSLLKLGDQPHRSLARLAKTHGPVMALKLGLTDTVVVSSPAVAREALQKKDLPLSDRWVPDAVRVFGHEQVSMIWGAATPSWKHLRAICSTHLFSVRSLDATRGLRQQKARDLVAYVRANAGRPIDVGRAVFGAVLNLISNTLFSFDLADLHSESTQDFRDLVSTLTSEVGKPNLSDFFPVLRIIDPQGRRRKIELHLKKLFKLFDEIIDQRLSANPTAAAAESGGDFLDALLQLHAQSKLERKAIRSLLADLFAAGTDTSTITTEWAMAELLKNPSKLARVRKEMEEAIGLPGQEAEESDVARLPYLQAVVKEVLRLHPPGPLLLPHRAAEAGVELGGYAVPEGARVLVNVWAMGRDEEVWAEPEAFEPERFLGREVDFRGRDFELIPFGSGRRACPGLPLAARMVHLLLASLLRAFDWSLPEGMAPADVDLSERFGATLAMASPLQAVAVPVVAV